MSSNLLDSLRRVVRNTGSVEVLQESPLTISIIQSHRDATFNSFFDKLSPSLQSHLSLTAERFEEDGRIIIHMESPSLYEDGISRTISSPPLADRYEFINNRVIDIAEYTSMLDPTGQIDAPIISEKKDEKFAVSFPRTDTEISISSLSQFDSCDRILVDPDTDSVKFVFEELHPRSDQEYNFQLSTTGWLSDCPSCGERSVLTVGSVTTTDESQQLFLQCKNCYESTFVGKDLFYELVQEYDLAKTAVEEVVSDVHTELGEIPFDGRYTATDLNQQLIGDYPIEIETDFYGLTLRDATSHRLAYQQGNVIYEFRWVQDLNPTFNENRELDFCFLCANSFHTHDFVTLVCQIHIDFGTETYSKNKQRKQQICADCYTQLSKAVEQITSEYSAEILSHQI